MEKNYLLNKIINKVMTKEIKLTKKIKYFKLRKHENTGVSVFSNFIIYSDFYSFCHNFVNNFIQELIFFAYCLFFHFLSIDLFSFS